MASQHGAQTLGLWGLRCGGEDHHLCPGCAGQQGAGGKGRKGEIRDVLTYSEGKAKRKNRVAMSALTRAEKQAFRPRVAHTWMAVQVQGVPYSWLSISWPDLVPLCPAQRSGQVTSHCHRTDITPLTSPHQPPSGAPASVNRHSLSPRGVQFR